MTQPDLFTTITRRGDSIVPPTPDELARSRRDSGMQRAAEHAGREWQDRAVALVRWYAGFHPTFLTEQVRSMAELRGLKSPDDARAWGAVMMRAAREKIVRQDGYAPANSSNGSPKRRWASLVGA